MRAQGKRVKWELRSGLKASALSREVTSGEDEAQSGQIAASEWDFHHHYILSIRKRRHKD